MKNIFLQDNGGCAEGLGRQSNAEQIAKTNYKPLGPDDLQTEVWPPMQTRDGRALRTWPDVMPGPEDTCIAYGRNWANVSNTPFREYKHWVHEGGIATPLIAHWPSGMKKYHRDAQTKRRRKRCDRHGAGALDRCHGHLH